MKLNVNEHNLENQHGNDPKKSIINSLHEKNRQLEKDLDQTKNKMNLLYSLLEKERKRRENAEKTCDHEEIDKAQILKALHVSKRQSSQDIQVFKAGLTSTLNNALQKVNSIIMAEGAGAGSNGEIENRQLQVKIAKSFTSLREQL